MIKQLPNQERLRELFDYDSGELIRKVTTNGRAQAGSIAGGVMQNGYKRVRIDKVSYQLHRVIYVWHYGEFDKDLYVDHINGCKTDNRIENLRLVTHQENAFNMQNIKGYSYCDKTGKYRATIKTGGRTKMLGDHDTAENAQAAYEKAKKVEHIFNHMRT